MRITSLIGCILGLFFGLTAKAIEKLLWLPCAIEHTLFGQTSCAHMEDYSLMIHVGGILALICFAIAIGSLGLSALEREE